MATVPGWICTECGAKNVWRDASPSPFAAPSVCTACGKVPFGQIFCDVEDGTGGEEQRN